MYTFSSTHNGSVVIEAVDVGPTRRPYHRFVRIIRPGRGSHHRIGQVYVQVAEECKSDEFIRQG